MSTRAIETKASKASRVENCLNGVESCSILCRIVAHGVETLCDLKMKMIHTFYNHLVEVAKSRRFGRSLRGNESEDLAIMVAKCNVSENSP